MTLEELVESVCTSLNDYKVFTKERVRRLIPKSANWVLFRHQWEMGISDKTNLQTVANQAWVNYPGDCFKEIALRHSGFKGRVKYITVQDYEDKLAEDSTPYGQEVVRYTVKGGTSLKRKRFCFLDTPTSVITINLTYSKKIDAMGIQDLPDEFVEVIKSHIIFRITPPMIPGTQLANPSFKMTKDDFYSSFDALTSIEQAQRGRLTTAKLPRVTRRAYRDFHK